MVIYGINILIIVMSMLGASINCILDKKIEVRKLLPAFWISWFFLYNTELYWYPIVFIVGFLAGRYCWEFGNYLERKWRAKQNRKRWGKFIN
tara:strand:- start:259 stop:534 length:276 start_codon:yes stop_codon:yes gene_type:complete